MATDWQKFVEELVGAGLAHGLVLDLRGTILAQSAGLHSSSAELAKIINEFNFCGPPPRPMVLTMVVFGGVQYYHAQTTRNAIQFLRADRGVGAISGYKVMGVALIGVSNEQLGNDSAFMLINQAGNHLGRIAEPPGGIENTFKESIQARNACR